MSVLIGYDILKADVQYCVPCQLHSSIPIRAYNLECILVLPHLVDCVVKLGVLVQISTDYLVFHGDMSIAEEFPHT